MTLAHDDRLLIRRAITHKDTWAEGQELILEEFLQRILWVLSDVQHVMLSNLVDVHGAYCRISEVRVLLTNEDSHLVGSFISSVQGKRNPQDQTTYTATSSVFLLLQCSNSNLRSIVYCWVVSYLLLPGTIQAGVLIEVYKLVGWSSGWWRCWCCCRNIVDDPAASTRTEFCECLSTTPAAAVAAAVRRRVVDRSARWLCCCCSMQITAPHSCCFLPSRW